MKRIVNALISLILLIMLLNCARRGTPSGGPKDITPPVLLKASPELNSTNFDGKKIRLTFDEYVKLKELQKQLIISPPSALLPEIKPQGSASKTIEIIIKDTLRPNTTYVYNFGQSIVDNNEENPYPFFKYVFSTGDEIDSLTLSGRITDALKKEPEQFVSVMLYEIDSAFTDSIVYKKPPNYLTNTLDSTTTFEITNLREGKYMLIALKDVSSNNVFDQRTDKIGFVKEVITIPTDSSYTVTLFKEIPDFRASKPKLASKNRIIFGYEGIADSMQIEMLSNTPEDFRSLVLKEPEKDTLNFWFTPFEADSLNFLVTNESVVDTFTVKIKDLYRDSLQINPVNRQLQFDRPYEITSNIPISKSDKDKISLIDGDSTVVDFTTELDQLENRLKLFWNVAPNKRYLLTLYPEAITDFYGNPNDTLNYSLASKSYAELGNISLQLRNVKSYPLIVQITDDKGTVIAERYVKEPKESYDFRNLNPGEYYLRVIFDENENGIYDTGNYLLQRQPERIVYYPEAIELRENWELKQEFILE
ncbi:Ig-like domain-containing protein [Flavobacteriaceae bacterium M23B6Z8]